MTSTMTAAFADPRAVAQPQNSRSHYYHPAANPYSTPVASLLDTPSTISPSSPRNFTDFTPNRQLRPPRTVLPTYIPAVLRPTERPSRAAPPTPPKSAGSSFDKFDGRPGALDGGVISRMVTDEWSEDGMGKVTGPPTRNHWKPDSAATHCDHSTCNIAFTLLTRRHHCRRCGNVFCADHSRRFISLDQNALFRPDASLCRSCDTCWNDYRLWQRARRSRASSTNGDTTKGTAARPATGSDAVHITKETRTEFVAPKGTGEQKVPITVGSVPAQWSWSTF